MTVTKVKNFSLVQRPTHNKSSLKFHCPCYQIVHKGVFNRFQCKLGRNFARYDVMGNGFKGPIIAHQTRNKSLMATMYIYNANLELKSYPFSYRNNPQIDSNHALNEA